MAIIWYDKKNKNMFHISFGVVAVSVIGSVLIDSVMFTTAILGFVWGLYCLVDDRVQRIEDKGDKK